jgi:5,5'-dehydrodivanillate O-demethylase oxygenase subunit
MGELLRRYWMPVAASCEVAAGATQRVLLLGEKLVLYRDLRGRLGLVDERCPHRGTSLALGCVDAEGIRCPYHGWKFDLDGRCLETPAEPADSTLSDRVRARAYPVQELGGLAFAYLGPDPAPLLPRYDLFVKEGVLRDIGVAVLPCNWVQIMENSVDPHHLEWLHGHHLAHTRAKSGASEPTHYRKRHVKIGFDIFEYGIVKRRILEGGSDEDDDWKVGHPLVFPFTLRVGAQRQHRLQFRVPMDDTHTRHYWYACYEPAPGRTAPLQPEVPLYEVQWRDANGEFIVDFVDGGDIMACVTQGAIADRTRETLGASDQGIALYRRLLFQQAERVRMGEDPIGIIRDPLRNDVVELPQEREKYGGGGSFLRESIEMGHARYSPLKEQIIEMLELLPAASASP